MDFTNPLVYGVPCFLGLIALEYSYSKSHRRISLYETKDLMASLGMGIGSAIIAPLIKTISAIVIFNLVYDIQPCCAWNKDEYHGLGVIWLCLVHLADLPVIG